MELITLLFLTLLLLVLIYGAFKSFYSIWWKPKKLEKQLKRQGIKGTPYKLLLGDIKELVKQMTQAWSKPMNLNHQISSRVDPFTYGIVQKYGKIAFFWTGTTPRVTIMEMQLVKEVLSNKHGNFQKPPLNDLILILTRGLTTLEGEKWATHRRIINPAFHLEKLKGMIPVFATSCDIMIEKWKKLIGVEGTCEVDIWPEFQNLTGDIISRTAFGSNFEEGKKIFELQKEMQVLVIEALQTLYIPGLRFIPTKKNQRRKQLNKQITSMLRILIEKKEIAMQSGESSRDDLLGVMLQSNNLNNIAQNDASCSKDAQMTMEEIIEECKQFYLAGHETTSSWLTWTIIVLAMHPDWQDKARKEILQICGKNDPDSQAINHLKIVSMILNEVLRLYPPVIALYQHTYKNTQLGEIFIPAEVGITLPILLINHSTEIWGYDALEFKPERFSEGISKATKDQTAFLPFGWGPRTCIGQNFALIEAKVALAMILQNFSFELATSYAHAPKTVMTLQPQHGAQIIMHLL